MLKKIMKHDFQFIKKIYFPIFIGALFITFFCVVIHKANYYLLLRDIHYLQTTTSILDILMFGVLIAVPSLTFILLSALFYKTVAGDEGYLTHTLPVPKRDIVIGKNLIGLFFNVISTLITIFCLMLFFICTDSETQVFSRTIYPSIQEILSSLFDHGNILMHPEALLAAILFILSIVAQNYANISYGFLCVSMGQMMNKHKIIFTILFGIGINTALSTISSILLSILSIAAININLSDLSGYLDGHYWGSINILGIFALLINLGFAAICNFTSIKLLESKLNLE